MKVFENTDFDGSTKVREIIFEKERQTVRIVLNRIDDEAVKRNTEP